MKRKNEKVPEFDEIIFENRNKNYGAYDLRKRNKTTTCFSILFASTLSAILFTALSVTPPKEIIIVRPNGGVYHFSKPVDQVTVAKPEPKPNDAIVNAARNLRPVVTDDTSAVTHSIPITDDLNNTVQNRNVNDTGTFTPAASDPVIPIEPEPVITVQEMPEFPGGTPALMKFVSDNLKYPEEASSIGIQGKVILKFVVRSDGSVDRIEIIRGIDPALDNEAVRVVKTLPKFKPGRQAGIAVPVWFMLPVTFRIETR